MVRNRFSCGILVMIACGCVHDPEIIRPPSGEPFLQSIPSPAIGGPFDSYSHALLAACQKILEKPNATAGHHEHRDFIQRWMLSTEYCAWIYYTPEHKYEISRLSNHSRLPPSDRRKSCFLPSQVDDPRYPQGAIKYISALHNHPYGSALSDSDIRTIVAQGFEHGFEAETRDGTVFLSVVAFFSNGFARPTCDGFHMYVPAMGTVVRWTQNGGKWSCRQTGVIRWRDADSYDHEAVDIPCSEKVLP
jgi:hypothetical protein